MKELKYWLIATLCTALLFIIGIAIYLVRNYLPILGLVTIWSIILAIPTALLLAITFGVVHIRKLHTETEVSEIGQYGSVVINNGTPKTIAPLTLKLVQEKEEKKPVEIIQVPKVYDLLISGYLPRLVQSGTMLLGYRQADGTERTGTYEDIRTCAIGGKSRNGKSTTMLFLTLQFVLAQANVYVCDKHFAKDSSLYKQLLPLHKYIRLAGKHPAIIEAVEDFMRELDARINNTSTSRIPTILIVDEYTQISMDKQLMKIVSRTIHRISNEGAGFNMFALIGGQSWQASFAGGNALINSLHAAIVHHLEEGESKKLLGAKRAKLTVSLPRGYFILKDTSGDSEGLITPLATRQDAEIVARILETSSTHVYQAPFEYQTTLNGYNPALLTSPSEGSNVANTPIPPTLKSEVSIPLLASRGDTSTSIEPLQPNPLHNGYHAASLADNTIVSEDGAIRISETEQIQILDAIVKVMQQPNGLKADGKVNRTRVRDTLGYNNKQYKRIEVFCNARGL